MNVAQAVQTLTVYAIPTIFAITLHEAAHGYAARRLGDPTAWQLGRVSLNPARHIDPVGTVLLPALGLLLGGVMFGWAKPVPVDGRHFKQPRRDWMLVALAGPLANLLMVVLWAILLKILASSLGTQHFFSLMAMGGVMINAVFMVLNLLPIPPLDGSRVVAYFLPPRWLEKYQRLEPYGLFIVLFLLFAGVLMPILHWGIQDIIKLLDTLLY